MLESGLASSFKPPLAHYPQSIGYALATGSLFVTDFDIHGQEYSPLSLHILVTYSQGFEALADTALLEFS